MLLKTLLVPDGPRSGGVYWLRRLVALAVLGAVVAAASWGLRAHYGQHDAGPSAPQVVSATATPTPTPTAGPTPAG